VFYHPSTAEQPKCYKVSKGFGFFENGTRIYEAQHFDVVPLQSKIQVTTDRPIGNSHSHHFDNGAHNHDLATLIVT
jgi:hypothetical protein